MDLSVISRSDDSEATAARPIGDTIIPRAYGMISKLGSAQARCIPWPRDNLMHPSGQALHSKVSTIARHNSANQGNSVALTEVFKHNSIDNALQSVVGHKRKVHDIIQENIGREDTHSTAKKIGKARPDSPYANFTNSQLLTTSRFKCTDRIGVEAFLNASESLRFGGAGVFHYWCLRYGCPQVIGWAKRW
uniref:Uncharacterized protein n=1 Tax=Oryza rufipogon TaxID=4529 RepID=A0A0E0REW0_ORYRU